ncbi:hypothetical protein SAMN05443287_102502 [Micromonospora phaseoli]|uniref:Pectate lyase superfamily protein n=1 Tax=Micromonospora phaseoli TaxID=1144548 RepID=A0A1H6V6L1_9ACTN|nr:hypothetical protein [Micromonospora phaseoli]PZV93745.1 hypothetical protein CLV64_109204 [Micromonospora phaseoli]GIJ79226.1 hypothetical protein Xph01_36580 [Micromonospora phaseoli]SEI98584.1 hypothetical protein SAMN05443287_102502 [Micromonospora phaseoli]
MTDQSCHDLVLTQDAATNQETIERLLAAEPGGTVRLPAGTFPLARGIVLGSGWTLAGAGHGEGPVTTWLTSSASDGQPIVQVLGSQVVVEDIGFRPPPCSPGEHGGDRGTAITIGSYLYPAEAEWIEGIRIRRVRVERGDTRAANCIAVVGAVRDITISDVSIVGGCTGIAVHWGAVGAGVDSIVGPSYHPHHLTISDLHVSDAFEGFYLSSVHDVEVDRVRLSDVEIGFRLLPGDNTDRFHSSTGNQVGQRIRVSGAWVSWNGPLYAIRIAGWGRSEIDHSIRVLEYRDVLVQECTLVPLPLATPESGDPLRPRSPVVIEQAPGVVLDRIRIDSRQSS